MKTPPNEPASSTPRPARSARRAGLTNEARPGLGTQTADHALENPRPGAQPDPDETEGSPRATPRGYVEPRPEPREQAPDSFAHEQERSTGVSGHLGNA